MQIVSGKAFAAGQSVDLDDTRFEKCSFTQSVLVFRGGALPEFVECQFTYPMSFQLADAAQRTLNWLHLVRHQMPGGAEVVEKIVATLSKP